MPLIETRTQLDKAVAAYKDYQAACRTRDRANSVVQDKLAVLKTITGLSGNDALKVEEEILRMLGVSQVQGVKEE